MNTRPAAATQAQLPTPFPDYGDDQLRAASLDELMEWLRAYGDRVPRALIDECARRGEPMEQRLVEIIYHPGAWERDDSQEAWMLPFNAAFTLGLMESVVAGEALGCAVSYDEDELGDTSLMLIESFQWPALFRNKPAAAFVRVRSILDDRELPPRRRAFVVPILLEHAVRAGAEPLEQLLDALAAMAGNLEEDLDFRIAVASMLIDFPRPRYRDLLRQLAAQGGAFDVLTKSDVHHAYASGRDQHGWEHIEDPWKHFSARALRERQQQRERDAALRASPPQQVSYASPRVGPKVGRNDPCPCGSGKKHKKCCLAAGG